MRALPTIAIAAAALLFAAWLALQNQAPKSLYVDAGSKWSAGAPSAKQRARPVEVR